MFEIEINRKKRKKKEILYQEDLGCDPGATEKWRCGRQIFEKNIFADFGAPARCVAEAAEHTCSSNIIQNYYQASLAILESRKSCFCHFNPFSSLCQFFGSA